MGNKTGQYKMVPFGSVCGITVRNSDYFRVADFMTENEGIIAISPNNVWYNKISYDDVIFLSRAAYNKNNTATLGVGDIVIVKYCKPKTAPYRSALVEWIPEGQTLVANPSLLVVRNITCNPKYLQLVITSSEFQRILNTISTGSMNAIAGSGLAKIMIPLPEPEEQERIVSLLWEYRNKHDELITLLQQEINSRTSVYEATLNSALWE